MSLPETFRFSQAGLQDYVDCKRRFELRYLDRLLWPAIESEPVLEQEARMQRGQAFHRLIQAHQAGVDPERIEASLEDPDLLSWWRSYLDHPVPDLPPQRRTEFRLSIPFGGYRLAAAFDLLAYEPGGRFVIVDWKTGPKPAARAWLADRLQTRVYPYVLAAGGAGLNGGEPVRPEQVSLVYWSVAAPEAPQVFEYSDADHAAAGEALAALVAEIAARAPDEFPLTDDLRTCRYCVYRSLCDRGREPGEFEERIGFEIPGPEDFDPDLGLDQVGEIEF
ncbi:MAG TPA: PD-(D/E)XK nuclease family protein [Anaerolineales bacterium]|nr:PD-(D/E)XK nuclease family protein [Anaerolineales bacterium]